MEKIVDYLKQLDLSDVEAKLYLTLLQTGPTSVRDLAETIDIKRTTTYFYIDQLIDKGLLMKLVRGSKKLVAANEPEELKSLVEAKLENAKTVQKNFPGILKTLEASLPKGNYTNGAEIKYYKGKTGVKKIYEDVLKAKEVRSYVNIEEIAKIFPENFQLFDHALKNNPDIKMFEIVEDSPQAREITKSSSRNKKYLYKMFPKDVKLSSTDILIYDGSISIIHLTGSINGLILHNTELYNNFKVLFDFMWKVLPEITY
ncbi:MAG TPA: helix-turn-helix domain-containing protein [Candidatus Acidoferrales bacterium]|nr:helix-turn-helix domain-containing protein [Candidatus Acidoferrales bacterium]